MREAACSLPARKRAQLSQLLAVQKPSSYGYPPVVARWTPLRTRPAAAARRGEVDAGLDARPHALHDPGRADCASPGSAAGVCHPCSTAGEVRARPLHRPRPSRGVLPSSVVRSLQHRFERSGGDACADALLPHCAAAASPKRRHPGRMVRLRSTHAASWKKDAPGCWPADMYLEARASSRGWFSPA
jgi:hypothetical protein